MGIPNIGDNQVEEVFFKVVNIIGRSWTIDNLEVGHCIGCNG